MNIFAILRFLSISYGFWDILQETLILDPENSFGNPRAITVGPIILDPIYQM